MTSKKIRVFLVHAVQDKPTVRDLYARLKSEAWIDPWFDEENLLPGQDWDLEIQKTLRSIDAVIICLSKVSVAKSGYVQKEIKRALDILEEKPEGTIYIIPLRLDDCEIPSRLQKFHWVDYFNNKNYDQKLLGALKARAESLGIETSKINSATVTSQPKPVTLPKGDNPDFYQFIKVENPVISYPFWMAKYPVTNLQYARFLQADDFAKQEYWLDFPKYDENYKQIGTWKDEGFKWLQEQLKDYAYFPMDQWKVEPRYLEDPQLGIAQPNNPVVGINWYEANAYCKWLAAHWNELPEFSTNGMSPQQIRLPLEMEWVVAAGGDRPENRFPWDKPGKATTDIKEIIKRANISESKIKHTTPVNQYPEGKSPYGVMDMSGNIWEWQTNFYDKDKGRLSLRGGSGRDGQSYARVSGRYGDLPFDVWIDIGFRVLLAPPSELL